MRKSVFVIVSSSILMTAVFVLSFNMQAAAYDGTFDDLLISAPAQTENTSRIIALIKQGLSTIPRHVKRSLSEAGYCILIVPMTEDIENPGTHPNGYAENRSWRNVAGVFTSNKKQIIVAERVCRRSYAPVFNKHADETVRHEIGHAYDQFLGNSLEWKGNISASSFFKTAYDKDSSDLTEQQRKEFHYFLQSDSAGKRELFAELFSTLCSQKTSNTTRAKEGINLVRCFPGTTQLVKDLINEQNLQRFK